MSNLPTDAIEKCIKKTSEQFESEILAMYGFQQLAALEARIAELEKQNSGVYTYTETPIPYDRERELFETARMIYVNNISQTISQCYKWAEMVIAERDRRREAKR